MYTHVGMCVYGFSFSKFKIQIATISLAARNRLYSVLSSALVAPLLRWYARWKCIGHVLLSDFNLYFGSMF